MNHTAKRTLCGITVGLGVVAFFLYCPLKALPVAETGSYFRAI